LGFATSHAVLGFVDFVQGEFFDHGADAGVLGEAELSSESMELPEFQP